MKNYKEELNPDSTYHIYGRAIGFEKLFRSKGHYHYFLRKYQQYMAPVFETYCYCLMPNHYHFLVEVKELAVIKELVRASQSNKTPALYISHQFGSFLNCYAKSINKQYQRKGSLFIHPFSRKRITDHSYLYNSIRYIHKNPVNAGLCYEPENWQFSSYHGIIKNNEKIANPIKALEVFEDIENFRQMHEENHDSEFDPAFYK